VARTEYLSHISEERSQNINVVYSMFTCNKRCITYKAHILITSILYLQWCDKSYYN